jgi:hypothetical protein
MKASLSMGTRARVQALNPVRACRLKDSSHYRSQPVAKVFCRALRNGKTPYIAPIWANCDKLFTDKIPGSKAQRKGLEEALAFLRPGDIFVVWKLDRAGRSLNHLIDLLSGLKASDTSFISLTEQNDTTTPGGKLIFHLMGALAEFERDLIRERTNAGLAQLEPGDEWGADLANSSRMQRQPWLAISGLRKATPSRFTAFIAFRSVLRGRRFRVCGLSSRPANCSSAQRLSVV